MFLLPLLGGLFKTVFGLFVKIFSDWRILLTLAVALLIGLTYWQFKVVSHKLELKTEQAAIAEKNNEVLRKNEAVLQEANAQNAVIITQLQKDKQISIDAVTDLSTKVSKNNQVLMTLQSKINSIKAPPTPLTPYFVDAIDGIQKQRAPASAASGVQK
jgi:hypothetical protein